MKKTKKQRKENKSQGTKSKTESFSESVNPDTVNRRIVQKPDTYNKEKDIKEIILDWCWKNNTIPFVDLHNLECECGHSVLHHEKFDIERGEGNKCNHKYCTCPGYCKKQFHTNLHLASTDGGWINVLKLEKFLKEIENVRC